MGISIETLVASKNFTSETVLGGGAVVGKNVTISSIAPIDGGNRIIFSYTLDDGTVKTSILDVMDGKDGKNGSNGAKGAKGDPGTNGADGVDGIGITSVEKTNTKGLVDTYTITFTDGSTFSYDVTNGKNGKDGSGSSSGEENTIESVSVNGTPLTPDKDKNVDIPVPTVDVTKEYVDTALDDKAEKNHTHAVVNGHTVESDVPTDAKFTDTIYDDSTLKSRVSKVEENIGDVTTIKISSVSDLVSAINALYDSFMSGMTYKDKKLTINYRNGLKTELDLSPIITDTSITELSNVDDTGITDGQLLKYDTATSKYIPTTIDTAKVLADAKKYADDEIAKMNHMDAIAVDKKPTYFDGTITYVKNGETLTTENSDLWFYYNVDGMNYQTLFIDGVEFTISVDGDIDFKDFVSKANDIADTYTGEEVDKSKIANIGALDALYAIVATALGKKVNSADIVDSLVSDAVDKPLSAAQGKALDEKKLNVEDVVDNLTTTDTDKPLSANQGKVLDNKISDINKATKEQFGVAEGSFIHIEDSVNGNTTEIGIVGKSTQNQYTGKNILTYPYAGTPSTKSGITFTDNKDCSIYVNGTATADVYFNFRYKDLALENETYTLSCVNATSGISVYVYDETDSKTIASVNSTKNEVTFTPDNTHTYSCSVLVKNNTTASYIRIAPMIVKGETADDYEPYIGCLPSPSPEYPQSIISVGDDGNVVVESHGKNLIPFPYYQQSGEVNGVTWTVNDDGTVTANGTATGSGSTFNFIYAFSSANRKKLSLGQTYIFSDGVDKSLSQHIYSQLIRQDTLKGGFNWALGTRGISTFTANENNLLDYGFRTVIDAGITVENLVIKPQLEIGEKATEYEKYKSSITTISLSASLRSIGGIKDEITCQSGKFGVLRRIGHITIDGVNNKISFVSVNKDTTGVIQCNIPPVSSIIKKQAGGKLLCTRFRHSSSWNVGDIENTIYEYQNGVVAVRLPLSVTEVTDVTTANTYFSTHPFDVLYILDSPTFEELDQNIPYGVTTYKGITNISNKDAVDMSVKYPLTDSAASGSKNEARITELESKVTNDCVTNTVSLQFLVPDGVDVADYVSSQGKTYLRYYTTTNSKVTNAPVDTSNGYIWYCLDANLVITARNSKGEIWTNAILNGKPIGWKKMINTTVEDIGLVSLSAPKSDEIISGGHTIHYMVKNGVCYVSMLNVQFKTASDTIFDIGAILPKPINNYFWYPLIGVGDPTKSTLIHPTLDGKLEHHNTDVNKSYSGSFSYIVAES